MPLTGSFLKPGRQSQVLSALHFAEFIHLHFAVHSPATQAIGMIPGNSCSKFVRIYKIDLRVMSHLLESQTISALPFILFNMKITNSFLQISDALAHLHVVFSHWYRTSVPLSMEQPLNWQKTDSSI